MSVEDEIRALRNVIHERINGVEDQFAAHKAWSIAVGVAFIAGLLFGAVIL